MSGDALRTVTCGSPSEVEITFKDQYGNDVRPSSSTFKIGMALLPPSHHHHAHLEQTSRKVTAAERVRARARGKP